MVVRSAMSTDFKYAKLERERRFLLAAEPPTPEETRTIEDRYILGTHLRLRRVSGETTVLKLGKQEDLEPGVKRVTTIYLTEGEFAVLAALPASAVSKTRATFLHGERRWAVDTYPDGTRIAETEEEIEGLPTWVGEEITGCHEWTGAALASKA